MTTLAEHIIVAGAENRPPMLEKSMYDSWASHIRLFVKGKKNAQQLQDDCDVQATNIILHGLPPDVYAFVNHQKAAKDIWDRVKLLMKGTELSYQERKCILYNLFDKFASVQGETLYPNPLALVANSQTLYNPSQSPQHLGSSMYPTPQQFTPVYAAPIHHQHHHTLVNPQQQSVSLQPFISPPVTQQSQAEFPQLDFGLAVPTCQQGEDLIDCINKAMAFLSVSFAGTGNRGIATTSRRNYAAGQAKVVKCYNCLGEGHMAKQCTQPKMPRNSAWFKEKLMLAKAQEAGQILDEEQLNSAFQTKDLDAYDSDYDDISSAKAVLIANLSSYDSDVLFEVPYSDTYLNDMINQDESQDAGIQDTNSSAPNDLLVLSFVEQMTDHVANLDKEN
ncbi:copia protein [Tanacetum coccineum]